MQRPALGLNRWDVTDPQHFADDVARAEQLGWDQALILCNPLMTWDPYALLAVAALRTERIVLGTLIDNPVLRDPAVLANAIATVDALAPGRTRLAVGAGDTAVRFLGRRPARVAEQETAVANIKTLLNGGEVAVGAPRPARLHHPRPVPVWLAAGGPRTLAMAGRCADGVFLRVGRNPANLAGAVRAVRAGAAESGRHPDEVAIGLVIHTITSRGRAEISAISRSMAAGFYEYSPALFEQAGLAWDGPPIAELKRQVWPDFHHSADLVATGGRVSFLSQQAADSFSVFGSPGEMAEQLRSAIDGVGRVDVVVPHPVPNPPVPTEYARWFIEEVWPLV